MQSCINADLIGDKRCNEDEMSGGVKASYQVKIFDGDERLKTRGGSGI